MMCLKIYEVKSSSDFENWGDWVNFVNENIRFANEESTIDDYVGKCKSHDLPSFHPYWKKIINNYNVKVLEDLEKKYAECRINPDKIKYYFNRTTNLSMIEEKIETLKRKMGV